MSDIKIVVNSSTKTPSDLIEFVDDEMHKVQAGNESYVLLLRHQAMFTNS